MLKLTKYEFRKNRTFLIIIAIITLLLEGYFLFNVFFKETEHIAVSGLLLYMYACICFFMVFILSINNYSKELNSKSSYLIFMTPNSTLNIVLSKMLSIFIIGAVIVSIFAFLAWFDITILTNKYPSIGSTKMIIDFILTTAGLNMNQMLLGIVSWSISFIISFFTAVTLVYLSITLSATLLQNNKFKGMLSCIIFFILTAATSKIRMQLPQIYDTWETANISQMLINQIPSTLFNLCIVIACVLGSAALLDKKVSL